MTWEGRIEASSLTNIQVKVRGYRSNDLGISPPMGEEGAKFLAAEDRLIKALASPETIAERLEAADQYSRLLSAIIKKDRISVDPAQALESIMQFTEERHKDAPECMAGRS